MLKVSHLRKSAGFAAWVKLYGPSDLRSRKTSRSGVANNLELADKATMLEMSTRLLQNLRSPPENAPARVVLWSIPWKYDLCTEIVDALGLGLKIPPSFFDSLISITRPIFKSLRPNGSDTVKIGNSVATVARDYQLGGDAPPVLLIAGNYDLMSKLNVYPRFEQPYHKAVEEVLERGINGRMLPYRSASDKCSSSNLAPIPSNQ